jgi:sugar phosphate isomerase/epimerase
MYFTIGTSQGSLMSQQPLIDNLDKLEALPIRRFEVFGFPEHLDVRDSAAVVKVAKEGRRRELHWESIHAPAWQGPYDLSSLDEDVRHEAVQWNAATIRAIRELGGQYCVTHAGDRIEDPDERPKRLAQSARSFAELLPIAEEQQIPIALENILDPYAPQCLAETVTLMKEVSSSWFRPIFDVGHAFLSDGLDLWFDAIAKPDWDIIAVHVTDNHGRVRNTSNDDEHLFPFQGIIPWEDVFKRIRQSEFDGPVTIECALDNELFPRFEKLLLGDVL